MTSERIKEIQEQTAYPNSVSVQQALLQVWNECSKAKETPTSSQTEISDGSKGSDATSSQTLESIIDSLINGEEIKVIEN